MNFGIIVPVKPNLHILYVGQLDDGGTCTHRMRVLRELGYRITPFNYLTYLNQGPRIVRSVRFRWSIVPGIGKLNRDLIAAADTARPDLIWVDKGRPFYPQTIQAIKRHAPVVHYNPDDPFGHIRRGWRHFIASLPDYDVHLVPRAVNVQEYANAGARHVIRYYWSFHPDIHHPRELSSDERQKLGGPVGFIGQYELPRENAVYHLASHGINVRIWGPGWDKCGKRHENLAIEGRPLYDNSYALALCAFDVNLGFLMKVNRDLMTQRSVEIPACGRFLLAERTSEHLELFEEGKEAEFFGNHDELLEKARFYLANPSTREKIAAAGRERCLRSGYSNQERLKTMLRQVSEVVDLS
jgi:hypothetical protein